MRAHGLDVLAEQIFASCAFFAARGHRDLARFDVVLERHLCIDGNRLPARQVDHHVGSASASLSGDRGLSIEVDVAREARRLDDPTQLRLAPHTTGAVRAQGARKRLGCDPQLLVCPLRLLELLGKRAVLQGALALQVADLLLHRSQRLAHRAQGLQHSLLSLLLFNTLRLIGTVLRHQLMALR